MTLLPKQKKQHNHNPQPNKMHSVGSLARYPHPTRMFSTNPAVQAGVLLIAD